MRGFALVALSVVSLFLAVTTYTLRGQVRALRGEVASCGVRLDAAAAHAAAAAATAREQRIARRVRELREVRDEEAEVWRRLLATAPQSDDATSRPSPTQSGRGARRPTPQPR